MAKPYRCLMIGAGGMAGFWIRHCYPQFSDRASIVAVVDIVEETARSAAEFLDLSRNRAFTSMARAFETVDADFCTIVVPPAVHKEAVMHAVKRKLPILSEKPIADTWDDCLEIYDAVTEAGVKMQVVQNYRFTPRIVTMKRSVAEGVIGRPNYVIARFAADYRTRNAWGKFRHEIPHGLLVEGSVHHFDQMRNLAGADCAAISGYDWNPGHPSFDGECCGLFVARMTNDVRGLYEGNGLEAGSQNGWYGEYYRIEGDEGALAVDRDGTVRLIRHTPPGRLITEEISNVRLSYEAHNAIIDQFLTWLDGGPEPETSLADNIKSAAMLFGAIRASETGTTIDVESMVPAR